MAFARPTLSELVTRVQNDFVSRLNLSGAVLRRSLVYVLSRVVAGAAHMLHGHLDYLARQLFADKSDAEFLVRQASIFGLTKTAPTFARGTVSVTSTSGTHTVPAGSILRRSDGARYSVDADLPVFGTANAAVTALVAGADDTLIAGVVLTFESPVAGINATGTVTASTFDGSDQESTEALRSRLLARVAEPPMGGTVADYVAWCKAVAGVTRVWVTPAENGPGTVVVRFVRDGDVSPIPDVGEVAAVQAALDANAPAHATVTAFAPILSPLEFEISVVPNTAAIKAAVTAELADLLLRKGSPGCTILISEVRTTIGTTPNLTDYVLAAPVADIVFPTNELPSLSPVVWL